MDRGVHTHVYTDTHSSTHTQPDANPHSYECAHEYIHIPQTSLPTPITYICRSTPCMYVYIHPWTYVPLFIYICKHARMCKIYAERDLTPTHLHSCVCTHTHSCTQNSHVYLPCMDICIHMYKCVCGYVHPCTFMYLRAYTPSHIHERTYVCICACRHAFRHMYM